MIRDGHWSWTSYLLGRDIKGLCSHVDLLVDVHTGDDEEDPRTPGSARQQPTQPEDHRPLVLLITGKYTVFIM